MGLGAQIQGCEHGPQALFPEIEALFPKSGGDILSRITEFNQELAQLVCRTMDTRRFPVVLGGDHSVAIGTWNGVKQAIKKPFTLIWIDAHLDGHTHVTSPSNAIHGMPLAALLGHGHEKLAKLINPEPVLMPEHLILIGARSYEPGEVALFERLGVKVFWNEEVKKKGLIETVSEALSLVKTSDIGLSLDLDVIDPAEAPGVGSSENNGLGAFDLISALSLFKERLCAFELVEYNPSLDLDGGTQEIAHQILKEILETELVRSC